MCSASRNDLKIRFQGTVSLAERSIAVCSLIHYFSEISRFALKSQRNYFKNRRRKRLKVMRERCKVMRKRLKVMRKRFKAMRKATPPFLHFYISAKRVYITTF